MSLLVNGKFPPVSAFTSANVTADERSSAIDFVNRINYLFEEFNHDKMLSAFLDDSIVYHFHGKIEGREKTRRFFEDVYGYLIPGVTRHATNHIVDRDGEDGVMVRYHEQLFRNAWPAEVSDAAGAAEERTDGLPALWLFSPMIDRLRMTAEGWKISERYVGASTFNKKLDPPKSPGTKAAEPRTSLSVISDAFNSISQ
ncbi:hypothetical protein LTR56_008569 [Elasticomyces elasticus]|nr:hypothetical protein LTR56_008569 [Elasticomyces elasticus]KAK3653300.1 hypothetical protein LTR22_011260 [Elasticomyces elasticus]KAK4918254.1 hypothetical protein LTR49_013953 [Elasticomyces elasticus]KAK5758359.1 hypothetical protein LTS12_011532 [Elasticomyces elasticus]